MGSDDSNDIMFGDVDGDFDLDVVVINGTGDLNRLLINDGAGVFTDETDARFPVDTQTGSGGALVDVDGDGDLDLFVANAFIPALNLLWINDGAGHFTDESEERMPIYGEVSSDASHADIDNDGDFDLVIANFASQGPGIATRVFVNDGTGHFTDETEERYPVIEESTNDVAIGDVDNDGDVDLYIANFGEYPAQEQNRLLLNQSTPDSFPPSIVRTFHHPDTGDITADYLISSTVWDNIAVAQGELSVSLYYRAFSDTLAAKRSVSLSVSRPQRMVENAPAGDSSDFTEIAMLCSGGNLYRQNIPAQSSGTVVDYYIKAEDKMGNVSYDPADAPDSVFTFLVDVSLSIGDDLASPSLPKTFSLSQNYPNPFNPSTTIRYEVPDGQPSIHVEISIYDMRGRRIRTLVEEEKSPGTYQVHWDGRDASESKVSSGVYLYKIVAGDFISTRKMVIVR